MYVDSNNRAIENVVQVELNEEDTIHQLKDPMEIEK
jgi:hypothetical protein